MRIILGSLLALALASCPTLAPLASAQAAKQHSCCPAPADQSAAQGPDCCIRAAVPTSAVFVAPQFVVIAAVSVEQALPAMVEAFRLDSASLSPPDDPCPLSPSSRAPPSLLA